MLRLYKFWFLTLLILVPAAAVHAGQVSPDLHGNPGQIVDVIVQFKATADPGLLNSLLNLILAKGGILKSVLGILNAALYSIPIEAVADLANDPNVVYISPDRSVKGQLDLTAAAV